MDSARLRPGTIRRHSSAGGHTFTTHAATLWQSEVRNGEYDTMKRCLLSTPILKNWFGSFAVLIVWIFMILGLGMSQAGRDKNTSWKFYFIYRKCRVNPFFEKYDLSRGWTGRGGPHGERHAVATLHCYTAVTLLLHWHAVTLLLHCTGTLLHGTRPLDHGRGWLKSRSGIRRSRGQGLSITLYSLDTREMVK